MKPFTLLIALIFSLQTFAQSAPPSVKGQADAAYQLPKPNLQFPNKQVTNLGGLTSLIETGNKNRLVNPGFEHSTFSTGWNTSVTGTATITPAVETTAPLEGKKSGKYTCAGGASGGTCTIYQDVTTTHTPQGAAALYVKSDTAWNASTSKGVQVFSRKDGVNYQSKNVDVTSDKLFSVPVTLSNVTSTGVAAVITVAASQTIIVYLDEGYVGAADLKQDFSPVGPWIDYGAMTIGAVTTAPVKGTTAIDKVRCRVNGQDYECEYNYQQTALGSATAGSGEYIYSLPTGISMDSSRISFTTATLANADTYTLQTSSMQTVGIINTSTSRGDVRAYAYSATQFKLTASIAYSALQAVASNHYALNNSTEAFKFTIKFPGAGLASNYSAYSTTNADTDWDVCNFSTLAWNGLGTVTPSLYCKREGANLVMQGRVLLGTVAASEARIPLPLWNGSQLSLSSTKLASGLTNLAPWGRSASSGSHGGFVLATPSNQYLQLSAASVFGSTASSGLASETGANVASTGETISFYVSVPIDGWQNSNIIIGQFNGLESCADSYQCTDTFSAKISATGVVSDENLDWITGNCTVSNTAQYDCTFKTSLFTVLPNCEVQNSNTSFTTVGAFFDTINSSASTGRYRTLNTSSGAAFANPATITCQKTGADAVFKTARAVASDQNIATPGQVKVKEITMTYGNSTGSSSSPVVCSSTPCSIYTNPSSSFSSLSWASTGVMQVTVANGTFAANSEYECDCQGYVSGSGMKCVPYANGNQSILTNSSGGLIMGINTTSMSGTNANSFGAIRCRGVAP